MATHQFYLKPANKKSLYPIMFFYQDRGKKFRYFTKLFTKHNNIATLLNKPKGLEEMETRKRLYEIQKTLNQIREEGLKKYVYYTIEEVEQKFRSKISASETNKLNIQSEFFTYYDQFVEENRSIKSRSTIYHYLICKKTLLEFEKKRGFQIVFEHINSQFFQHFQNFLITDKKYLNNSVGGHIKNFKVFLNYAMRHEFTQLKFNFKDFKTINEEVEIIALTENELFKIFNLEGLTHSEQIARDYLCFECFTGLRFSDIGRLKNENIKEDFLVLKTQKTKDYLYVPLNVFAKEILNKYAGAYEDRPLPPPFANQVINRLIKDVAQKAELNELTMVEKFSGAKRITVSKPKYAFISTHTGRRTFITLSYEKGMQAEMVMKITGIKKWETLKKYLKVSEKSKLAKMNEFWNYENISNPTKISS